MGTSRSVGRDPTLSVDRDFDAANVCDKKTWMERWELVEQATFCNMRSGIGPPCTSGALYMLGPPVDYF